MFKQLTRTTSVTPAAARPNYVRFFSNSNIFYKPGLKHQKQKTHLSREEKQEQKMFDKNQATLDRMEHDSNYHGNEKKPNMEHLKEFGDNARIEQNRPDDGVY